MKYVPALLYKLLVEALALLLCGVSGYVLAEVILPGFLSNRFEFFWVYLMIFCLAVPLILVRSRLEILPHDSVSTVSRRRVWIGRILLVLMMGVITVALFRNALGWVRVLSVSSFVTVLFVMHRVMVSTNRETV